MAWNLIQSTHSLDDRATLVAQHDPWEVIPSSSSPQAREIVPPW